MQIIPKLFHYSNSIPQGKIIPIDSDESIPPAYVALRAGTTNRVVVPACQAGNRFLGSLKGLQIQVLDK
jgi:hypothetical protein